MDDLLNYGMCYQSVSEKTGVNQNTQIIIIINGNNNAQGTRELYIILTIELSPICQNDAKTCFCKHASRAQS